MADAYKLIVFAIRNTEIVSEPEPSRFCFRGGWTIIAIFVEGATELMLVSVLAQRCGHSLRDHAVSLISVEGLNFDCFLPLFGKRRICIPVAIITDGDLSEEVGGKTQALYPKSSDTVPVSDNTQAMLKLCDEFVGVFHGLKTLEYDLALYESSRVAMIKTLKLLHPKIGVEVETVALSAIWRKSLGALWRKLRLCKSSWR